MAAKKRKMTRKAKPKVTNRRTVTKKAARKAPTKSMRKNVRQKTTKAAVPAELAPVAVLEIVETTVYQEPEIEIVDLEEDLPA